MVALIALGTGVSAEAESSAADGDWTRITPGDARFYSELRGLSRIRERFRRLGIWEMVREIRDESGPSATRRPWQRRTEELLGLDLESTITELLGRRAALIATEPSQWDNGVVLAEVADRAGLDRLLGRWNAQPLERDGPVRKFVLSGGLLLAVHGDLLAFGPAGDLEGLWARTTKLMAGRRGASLGGRSDFAALRASLTSDPDGLLYVSWRKNDPTALAGCRRLLVGIRIDDDEIDCELAGHRAVPSTDDGATFDADGIGLLPASSLAVFTDQFDSASLRKEHVSPTGGAEASLLSLMIGMLTGRTDESAPWAESFGPTYTVVVDRDPAGRGSDFDLPAVTVLLNTTEGERIVKNFDALMRLIGAFIALRANPDRPPENPGVDLRKTTVGGVVFHSMPLGAPLAEHVGLSILKPMEPCWAAFEGQFALSTSRQHVERIVRAASGKEPRLADAATDSPFVRDGGPATTEVTRCLYVRGAAVSQMLTRWLSYLHRRHPQAIDPAWWQNWAHQAIVQRSPLGVTLKDRPERDGGALVVKVDDLSPALGRLLPGDLIVSANGRSLDPSRPAQSVADAYRGRGASDAFMLAVVREDKRITVTVPVAPVELGMDLQSFDPVRALRQLSVLLRRVESVGFRQFAAPPAFYHADLRICWTKG